MRALRRRLAIPILLALPALLAAPPGALAQEDLSRASMEYIEAIREVNKQHVLKPGKAKEADLRARLPRSAAGALQRVLAARDSKEAFGRIASCAEAALDLDLVQDFERCRARLEKAAPEEAKRIGIVVSRPRFLLRGLNGIDGPYLGNLAEVLEGVLEAYDRVFGFEEFSKVPGKKLRVRACFVDAIARPPHFAPQYPWHSEIDFPVLKEKELTSPTAKGQFMFYGLCHELGHAVAMWGNRMREEDRHQWAHYAGVTIVEELSAHRPEPAWMKGLRDVRWRSLSAERERLKDVKPSTDTDDGVLRTFVSLHDTVGPRAIGEAVNALDRKDERLRINGVRYYTLGELRGALLASVKEPAKRKAVEEILGP